MSHREQQRATVLGGMIVVILTPDKISLTLSQEFPNADTGTEQQSRVGGG